MDRLRWRMPKCGTTSMHLSVCSASLLSVSPSFSWASTSLYTIPQVCVAIACTWRTETKQRAADCGDYVVVTNARNIKVTGKKSQQLVYRHHTMFPGGLKEIQYKDMMRRKPDEVR